MAMARVVFLCCKILYFINVGLLHTTPTPNTKFNPSFLKEEQKLTIYSQYLGKQHLPNRSLQLYPSLQQVVQLVITYQFILYWIRPLVGSPQAEFMIFVHYGQENTVKSVSFRKKVSY